ncbi:MAG: insulinase family protein [Gammaproteobacteria bacterium]|nr:insulinase family protein [Gammaproteobacteria bacterium]
MAIRNAIWLLAALTVAGCAATATRDPGPAVFEQVLDNGLRVIVQPDHRAPVVVSQIWYQVGASDEPAGLTGISHVLEHMMFKGTPRFPEGAFSRIIAENGGEENAFTGSDYTAYFQRLEKSRLPIALELEADRMRNLVLRKDQFAKEVQVVMEERRLRTEDQPESLVYESLMAAAFQKHPYHHPIVGWMQDLQGLRVEDLRGWYQQHYAPDNATLVIVGDVQPSEVFALSRRYFGPLQGSRHVRPAPPAEPPQQAVRRLRVKAPAEVPYLLLGFHVPVPASLGAAEPWEPYALQLLSALLDGGEAARLARNLVRGAGVAASAGAEYDFSARYPSMFFLDANPANSHDLAEVEAALLAEISRLQAEPVGETELARVKAQVIASDVFQRDSMFYQGMRLGTYQTVGLGWRAAAGYVDRLRAVTAAQVQAVARRYLVENNMSVAWLDPQPIEPGRRMRRGTGHGHH